MINKTLRDKAEITQDPQDRQAYEAFTRGSIDNTFNEIGHIIVKSRNEFYNGFYNEER